MVWFSNVVVTLSIGTIAFTAMAAVGGTTGHFARVSAFIRSFQIKDGHLFLSLMANGGTYEFEPRSQPKGAPQIAAGS